MKRIISIVLVIAAAALVLCACGGKSKSSAVPKNACEGVWVCAALPENLSKYSKAEMDISSGDFKYTLYGEDSDVVSSGYWKPTGGDSLVMYADKQQVVDHAGKVLKEKTADASQAEKQPVYAKLDKTGKLSVSGAGTDMVFEKST